MKRDRHTSVPGSDERHFRFDMILTQADDIGSSAEHLRFAETELENYIKARGGKVTGFKIEDDGLAAYTYATVPATYRLTKEVRQEIEKRTGVDIEPHPEKCPHVEESQKLSSVSSRISAGNQLIGKRNIIFSIGGDGKVEQVQDVLTALLEEAQKAGGEIGRSRARIELRLPANFTPSNALVDKARAAGVTLEAQYP